MQKKRILVEMNEKINFRPEPWFSEGGMKKRK